MLHIYGIKNCDTMKKAMRWLDDHQLDYHFHDYRRDGLDTALLSSWIDTLGLDHLINKRGTTWRKLDIAQKDNLDRQVAQALLQQHPALIKRPLLVTPRQILLGFTPEQYESALQNASE